MLYQFDELVPYITNVVVIQRQDQVFVLDTFCGSDYMNKILEDYPLVDFKVILSHHDFDHVMGLPSFKGSEIIAHRYCKEWLEAYGIQQLKQYQSYLKGTLENVLPTITFDTEYELCPSLKLVSTIGHTMDSISLIDTENQCVYVGDNIEEPLCEMTMNNFEEYEKTLLYYQSLKMTLIGAHTTYISQELLEKHIQYMKKAMR